MDENHMTDHHDGELSAGSAESRIVVAIGPDAAGCELVPVGANLAAALHLRWAAVHVETPDGSSGRGGAAVAEALDLAVSLGAAVATVPGATVAEGIAFYLQSAPASTLVMGFGARRGLIARRSIVEALRGLCPDLQLLLVPSASPAAAPERAAGNSATLSSYAYAALSVGLTVVLALALNWLTGVRFLSILFLFPVIVAAARLGTKPALFAALLSAVAFNFFFLAVRGLDPTAVQSLIMATVLVIVALYTGMTTAKLRGRVALSERSAQEHARIAAFALELTRVSDWAGTAQLICDEVSDIFDLRCVLVREIAGELEIAAAVPSDATLEPLDWAALRWAWSHAEAADGAAPELSAANWRFHPLKTALGTLGIIGLAREDGRDPVPSDRKVLLATLIAQAALSLERLRLEDLAKAAD
jgi:two-component system sensor histidine kinase KdpD